MMIQGVFSFFGSSHLFSGINKRKRNFAGNLSTTTQMQCKANLLMQSISIYLWSISFIGLFVLFRNRANFGLLARVNSAQVGILNNPRHVRLHGHRGFRMTETYSRKERHRSQTQIANVQERAQS